VPVSTQGFQCLRALAWAVLWPGRVRPGWEGARRFGVCSGHREVSVSFPQVRQGRGGLGIR